MSDNYAFDEMNADESDFVMRERIASERATLMVENERLRAERDELRDVLLRSGFVPCDIPACNCGSWHHRYGLPERMQEIKDALDEAGHELSNANGNLTFNALKELVAERDRLRAALVAAMEIPCRRLGGAADAPFLVHPGDRESLSGSPPGAPANRKENWNE